MVSIGVESTIDLAAIAERSWDVVIIGAGPAGSAAAISAARTGAAVLLVERELFPRAKTCGGCVGAATSDLLARLRAPTLTSLGAPSVAEIELCARDARLSLRPRELHAISRERLDAALAATAIDAGAAVLFGACVKRLDGEAPPFTVTLASSPGPRASRPHLRSSGTTTGSATARARSVVVAAGLGGRLLDGRPAFRERVRARSPIGASAVIDAHERVLAEGVLTMAVGRGGYVGAVRREDGRIDVAAALDPVAVRRAGSVAALCARIRDETGLPAFPDLDRARFQGTPRLTRKRRALSHGGLSIAGDAASYVEPFTGDGIARALACGLEVGRAAVQARADVRRERSRSSPLRAVARDLDRRALSTALLAAVVRRPALFAFALRLLGRTPALSAALLDALSLPHAPSAPAAQRGRPVALDRGAWA